MQGRGRYREVLDWLTAQIDQLDAHTRDLADQAARNLISPDELDARRRAITDAHLWLVDQLEQALVARGLQIAA